MDDNTIIGLYWARSEKAIEETATKYSSYCYSIAFGILNNQSDSEECVNDTWLKAWNSIPPNKPRRLRVFLGKLTRNLSLDRYRYYDASKRRGCQTQLALEELQECVPIENPIDAHIEMQILSDCIDRFLRTQPQAKRDIFIRRYWFLESTKSIAECFEISETNVLTILHRVRRELKAFLEKEGVYNGR